MTPKPLRLNKALILALVAALVPLTTGEVCADEVPGDQLREVERKMEAGRERAGAMEAEATQLAEQLTALKQQSVETARKVREFESRQAELEVRLADLDEITRETEAQLEARRAQFVTSLMALQRIARHPPEAMLAQPTSPDDTVRSAILLRSVVPEIERRAAGLKSDLAAVSAARLETAAKRKDLQKTAEKLELERRKLANVMSDKADMRNELLSKSARERQRVAKLAEEAKSLKDLMSKLEARRLARAAEEAQRRAAALRASPEKKPAPPRAIASAPTMGGLPQPVIGTLTEGFGQKLDTGLKSKGIRIQARSGAQVIAPHDGTVVFSGIFRGYGQLLIIEHGEGYHTLLAGMSRIDGELGQEVLAGEPVGVMGAQGPQGGRDDRQPELYFELRKKGQPINPIPWLTARNNKVSG